MLLLRQFFNIAAIAARPPFVKRMTPTMTAVLALVFLHSLQSLASAQPAPFFAGKQIRLITHVGPASGYAVWARLVTAHLGRNIPGSPSIILQSMPGGGGVKAPRCLPEC